MTPTRETLDTDERLLEEVGMLLGSAVRRGLWLLFLDSQQRLCPTLVPIDGTPRLPGPGEGEAFAPLLDWLSEGEGAEAVAFVIERRGGAGVTAADREWARCLRAAALAAELLHDGGASWLPGDEYL
jgi:hypothetical protein